MRDFSETMTLGRTGSRAFVVIVLVLASAVTWAPGPSVVWAKDTPTDVEISQVLLVYTEDVEPAETYHGGGMIGVINRIFAGEIEAPLTAFFRVLVSAKLETHEDAPWRVRLIMGDPEESIGKDIKEAPNLSAEADFMVLLLEDWYKDLSEEDAEQLKESGSLEVLIEGPLDTLQTWTGPDMLTVTVFHQEAGQVRDLRFMRKTERWGFVPVRLVLLYEAFYVEARFKTPPNAGEEVVTINTQQVVVRQTVKDPKVYRSGELYLSPPPKEHGDGSTAQ